MDDYSITSLNESKNEWCARLVNILTPCIIEGLNSIFNEAITLCNNNNEEEKYLMTFQTFLGRIPNWNSNMIDDEKKRIQETSNCGYLEDLITCVHIIQLKALSCIRVGTKQKKIDIDIPSVNDFIHKIYIFSARKVYTNIYLFEKNTTPLSIQKNNRELETIIKECILESIRDTIPVEILLRAYMDETEEQDIEIKEEIINTNDETNEKDNIASEIGNSTEINPTTATENNELTDNISSLDDKQILHDNIVIDKVNNNEINSIQKLDNNITIDTDNTNQTSNINEQLSFSDIDNSVDIMGNEENLNAPKNIDFLEKKENERNNDYYEDEDEDEDDEILNIGDNVNLDITDIHNLNDKEDMKLNELVLNDIEVLT